VDTGVGCGVVNEAAIAGQPFLSTMLYDGNHSIDGVVDLAGRAKALLRMGEGVVCFGEWGDRACMMPSSIFVMVVSR